MNLNFLSTSTWLTDFIRSQQQFKMTSNGIIVLNTGCTQKILLHWGLQGMSAPFWTTLLVCCEHLHLAITNLWFSSKSFLQGSMWEVKVQQTPRELKWNMEIGIQTSSSGFKIVADLRYYSQFTCVKGEGEQQDCLIYSNISQNVSKVNNYLFQTLCKFAVVCWRVPCGSSANGH